MLKRGARSCESTTTLNTVDGSGLYDDPLVSVGSGDTVDVAMDECCVAGDQLFVSGDGGGSFGAPLPIGPADAPSIDASEAFGTVFGSDMYWAENNAGSTFDVEFAPLGQPSAGVSVSAMTDPTADFFTAGLGSYKGGVIAAGSDSDDVTLASFATAGSTVFQPVGQFSGEQLITVSGQAMLTQQTSGSQSLVLRLFNGTGFGSASVVPDSGGGGPNWNTACETPDGTTFVFTERNQDSYDLEMQSTASGSAWTPRTNLGGAIANNEFAAAVDSSDSGVVVGTSGPVNVFPVLAPQPVSFTLAKTRAAAGVAVKATGVGSSPAAGRTVELQRFTHGAWRDIAATTERAHGDFSFTITEGARGSDTFRAVASDLPGYLLYGYSPSRTLTVT